MSKVKIEAYSRALWTTIYKKYKERRNLVETRKFIETAFRQTTSHLPCLDPTLLHMETGCESKPSRYTPLLTSATISEFLDRQSRAYDAVRLTDKDYSTLNIRFIYFSRDKNIFSFEFSTLEFLLQKFPNNMLIVVHLSSIKITITCTNGSF